MLSPSAPVVVNKKEKGMSEVGIMYLTKERHGVPRGSPGCQMC